MRYTPVLADLVFFTCTRKCFNAKRNNQSMKQMQNMYISTTIIYTNDKIQISVFETFKRQFCLKFCYNPVRSSSLFFKASWLLKVQRRWKTSTTNDTKSENNLFSGTFHRNQIQAETHWQKCCDIILFQISACHCYNSNQPVVTCRNRVQHSSNVSPEPQFIIWSCVEQEQKS